MKKTTRKTVSVLTGIAALGLACLGPSAAHADERFTKPQNFTYVKPTSDAFTKPSGEFTYVMPSVDAYVLKALNYKLDLLLSKIIDNDTKLAEDEISTLKEINSCLSNFTKDQPKQFCNGERTFPKVLNGITGE